MSGTSADRRARILLWLGVVAGVGAAALGLLQSGGASDALPEDVVARVNGEPITAEAFLQLERAVVAERRGAALDDPQRERLLTRLVDEELLLQRGIALGLARHEPSARRAIVSAVVAAVTSDAEAAEPDEDTLRGFHAESADRFRQPGRVRARAVFVSTATWPESQAFQRASEAARRLRAGEAFETVALSLGDAQTAVLPSGLVPLETLREYLGPSPAQAVAALAVGAVGDPVRGGAGYYVVQLDERSDGELPPFERVRDEVRTEWLRTQGERALGDALRALREDGDVVVRLPPRAGDAPPP